VRRRDAVLAVLTISGVTHSPDVRQDRETSERQTATNEAKSFPEPLKKKVRAAARNASPVPVPETSYASIVASANTGQPSPL
jgi:hypothetical protein